MPERVFPAKEAEMERVQGFVLAQLWDRPCEGWTRYAIEVAVEYAYENGENVLTIRKTL